MANINKPKGLVPVGYLTGASWNGQARLYAVDASQAALYVGDPVTLIATSTNANGLANVGIGVAGSAIIGVIVGVAVATAGVSQVAGVLDLTRRSLPASTAGFVLVADDPTIIFEIQDGLAAGTPLADIGQNTNFLIAAGATTVSDSGTTSAATTTGGTTDNLKIIGFAQRDDNTPASQYAKLLVKINNHVYNASTGSASI
jgi:hypothetical protein